MLKLLKHGHSKSSRRYQQLIDQTSYSTTSDGKSTNYRSPLPQSCDAIVIGGGAVGCSTLYHLSKRGVKGVLIEKEELTAGTTWHTAGIVWRLRVPHENEIILSNITRDLFEDLEQETGVNAGFNTTGSLFVAKTDDRLAEYKRVHAFGKYMKLESHFLSPSDIKERFPLINVNDLVGAQYNPSDGHVDPSGYCQALVKGAQLHGAQVHIKTEVLDIETHTDAFGKKKVKAVNTSKGSIQTDNIIVCGGCWAPYLVESLKVKLPQMTFRHSYVVTERMEGVIGMPIVRDKDGGIYVKPQGDVLHIGGYEMNPVMLKDWVPKKFAFGLFNLDWDTFEKHMENAIIRIPEVVNSGIRSTVCGPESFTADGKPLLGPNPDIQGLFHNHGFNSGGLMLSGGAGKILADWVVDGLPEFHVFDSDIRRFDPILGANERWLNERCHELYARHYSINFLHSEPLSGRNIFKSPIHDELLDDGCVFQCKGGWERPGWFDRGNRYPILPYKYYGQYGSADHETYPYRDQLKKDRTYDYTLQHQQIKIECLNARSNANLFDMSSAGKFYLSGPDSDKAVEWIFSNDVNSQPGFTTDTCILNKHGKIESYLTVSAVDDDGPQADLLVKGRLYYVVVGGVFSPYINSLMQTEIKSHGWDCTIHDLSHNMALLSLQGPKSREILSMLTDADLSNEAFPFSSHQLLTVSGYNIRAMRISCIGELGWELHLANSSAGAVYRAVHDVGQTFGLKNSGYRAMDSLTAEKGYRMWHSDIRADDSPLEADLLSACKLQSNTDFLGRVALEKYIQEGTRKKLVCFTLPRPRVLHGLETIVRSEEIVGYLRRSEFAFALDKQIAWGYIEIPQGAKVNDYIMSGDYKLDRMGELIDAQVHMRSPFDPKSTRLQSICSPTATNSVTAA